MFNSQINFIGINPTKKKKKQQISDNRFEWALIPIVSYFL